jgi:hypothetical protein
MFHKMRDIVHSGGLSELAHRGIARAYRRIRRYSPKQSVRYAGIPICHERRLSDRFVPTNWIHPDDRHKDESGYEVTLIAGLNETVMPGDRVVIVGAGLGVTAVIAGRRAGPFGNVQCFEASEQYVALAQQAAARNNASNLTVHHAVVGKPIFVYGSGKDLGSVIPPSQLPPCDVLQLDCEGAEVDILRDMAIQPRIILVETHGLFGAPTEMVGSLLRKRGYIFSDRGLAEPSDDCRRGDIRVLLGIKKPLQGATCGEPEGRQQQTEDAILTHSSGNFGNYK